MPSYCLTEDERNFSESEAYAAATDELDMSEKFYARRQWHLAALCQLRADAIARYYFNRPADLLPAPELFVY